MMLGTSFASVVAQSKPNNKVHQIRMGGMMMGVDVPNIEHSIGKITNCIYHIIIFMFVSD
jgi:Na+-translocating ferredoxin:NAD+ oxidoreductase RnfC subunit